jgi:hypothetical protein
LCTISKIHNMGPSPLPNGDDILPGEDGLPEDCRDASTSSTDNGRDTRGVIDGDWGMI